MVEEKRRSTTSYKKRALVALFLLCCLIHGMAAAIILRPLALDETINITNPTDESVASELRIPVFFMSFTIKGPGFGWVFLDHSPLISATDWVDYELSCERGKPINYHSTSLIPEEVEFGHVWANLSKALRQGPYYSTIRIHLVVER